MRLRLGPLGAPVAIVLAWAAMRVTMLLPVPPDGVATHPRTQPVQLAAVPPVAPASNRSAQEMGQRLAPPIRFEGQHKPSVRLETGTFDQSHVIEPSMAQTGVGSERPVAQPAFRGSSGLVPGYAGPARQARPPLTGSVWALVNGTGGAVGVPSLGGSQAGMRLYLQGQGAPLALTARVSRALGRARDTEVSAGYALRGRGIGLLVERRERLDARDGAFVVTGYGGAYDVRLPAGLRFDGFAQAGMAGVHSRRWFADGQARITRRVPLSDRFSLGVGGGGWASAQQGFRRVEAGPLIETRVRAGALGLRVAGEYRFRVTGDANPASGPALTMGVDF